MISIPMAITYALVWALLITAAAALNQLNKYLKHRRLKNED